MSKDEKQGDLTDAELDAAQGGGTIPLENATVGSIRQEQLNNQVIEFQDGDDYFLRKRPGRSK